MNNAAGDGVAKIPLTVFGGAVTEMAPADLPEGASPFNQDCDFLPGSVFSRGGRQNVVAFFGLTAEDLGGAAIDIPIAASQPWTAPANAVGNLAGTYARALLNTAGFAASGYWDSTGSGSATSGTGGSGTIGVSATPSLSGEVALYFACQTGSNHAGVPTGYTDQPLLNGFSPATADLATKLLGSGTETVSENTGGGSGLWAALLILLGGNPVFSNQVGINVANAITTPYSITAGNPQAIPVTKGQAILLAYAAEGTQGFTSGNSALGGMSVTDSLGNTYFQLGAVYQDNGAGQGFVQLALFLCPSSIATGSALLTFNASTGAHTASASVMNAWTVSGLTSLSAGNFSSSDALTATNFAFNVPATTAVVGLEVEVSGHQTPLSSDAILTAQLVLPNGNLSPNSFTFQLPAADGQTVVGLPTSSWGVSLTAALLNNPNFGVRLIASISGGEAGSFNIYAVKMKAFLSPSPPQNFNYLKTFEQTAGVFTLALDAGGILWQEDAVNSPGVLNSIFTSILPNTFARSVTFQNTEYIAFSDLLNGNDVPRQWTGSNFDKISVSPPAQPPSFSTTANGSNVVSIAQASPFLLPAFGGGSANNWLLVSAGPSAHGTFGTPATPGNVFTIILASNVIAPAAIKVGTNIQISGFPTINGFSVNNDPTGVTNPAYYTVTSVGAAIPGQNSYDWITFQVPFTTFFNQQTPGGLSVQSTLATLTTAAQVPYLEVGNQFTLTGVTPAGWNNTFTVQQTPNAGVYSISQTSLTANVAQYVFTLVSGALPVVGQYITVTGTLNGNGVFNVVNAVITSVTANSFTVTIVSPSNISSAAENNSFGSIYGTVFVFDPAATVTNPIIGNAGATGSLSTTGVIGTGVRQGVCIFLSRNNSLSPPSPFATFNITATATAIVATNIPIGPPETKARILAFTGAGGANYFYLPLPTTVVSNGQNVTYTATQINDNVTTQATFSFPDAVLLNGTAIDVQGNNLFACVELPSCRGFLTYGTRLIAWGVNTKVFNLLNLTFGGGIGVQNLQQLGTQPSVPTFPLGWTVDSVNGAGGQVIVSALGGNSFYIKNSSGIVQSKYGMIEQTGYLTQLGTPIFFAGTGYSVRVCARCPSGVQTGNLVVDLFSPVLNQVFGSFTIPLSSMTTNFQVFTGTLLAGSGFPTNVPKDLLYRIYATNIPNNGDVELARTEPYITSQPSFSTQFWGSYIGNQELFDTQTGPFGPSQNQQRANGGMVLFDTLYMLKENSWFSTVDNGLTEPFKWNWKTVSDKIGTIGIHSYDYGEAWAVTACRAGVYYFEGGEPIKISQEIQTLWELINWKYGHTIWLQNDEANKTIKIGVPIATPNIYMPEMPANANPTSPNVVLHLSYRELNTGAELARVAPIRTSYSGRLLAPEPARKWSFWNVSAPCGQMIDRGNNSKLLLVGSGYGDSKIFQINAARTDDDGNAINSFYLTHGYPKPEIAEGHGIDLFRYTFDMMSMLVFGTGMLNTLIYPEDPQNAPYVLDTTPLDPISQGNIEIGVNATGNRYFVRVGTNAVGSSWKLSTLIGIFTEDPWAPVRGTAKGAL